jgi:hypothetical protein
MIDDTPIKHKTDDSFLRNENDYESSWERVSHVTPTSGEKEDQEAQQQMLQDTHIGHNHLKLNVVLNILLIFSYSL